MSKATSPKKSAKKKKAAAKPAGPSMIQLIVKAIGQCRAGPKGASRAAIANYLCNNNGKTAGAMFNAHLRKALANGVAKGYIKQGATQQRFKLGDNVKALTQKPKKKKPAKKKKPVKKKKATKKKKKTTTKKKKKTTTKKKKAGAKKSAKKSTKKKSTKKAGAKKGKKKTTKKKSAKKSKK